MTAVEAGGRRKPAPASHTMAASDADALHRRLKDRLATAMAQHRRAAMRQFAALVGGVAIANSGLVALLTAAGAHLIVVVATAFVGLVSTGALIGRVLMIHRDSLRRALMEPILSAFPPGTGRHDAHIAIDAPRFAALGLVPAHDDGVTDTLIDSAGTAGGFSLALARLVRNPDAAKKTGRQIVFHGLLIALACPRGDPDDRPEPQDILDALPGWDTAALKARVESDGGHLFVALPLVRDLFDAAGLLGPAARSREMAARLADLAVLPYRLAGGERPDR